MSGGVGGSRRAITVTRPDSCVTASPLKTQRILPSKVRQAPPGTIETLGFSSRTQRGERKHRWIVRDVSLIGTSTQHFVLGYFH